MVRRASVRPESVLLPGHTLHGHPPWCVRARALRPVATMPGDKDFSGWGRGLPPRGRAAAGSALALGISSADIVSRSMCWGSPLHFVPACHGGTAGPGEVFDATRLKDHVEHTGLFGHRYLSGPELGQVYKKS